MTRTGWGPTIKGSALTVLRWSGQGVLAQRQGVPILRASVRRHRSTFRGCLWTYLGWPGSHPAAPCSLLYDSHSRFVNAYIGAGPA
jgi:hypothetical protein